MHHEIGAQNLRLFRAGVLKDFWNSADPPRPGLVPPAAPRARTIRMRLPARPLAGCTTSGWSLRFPSAVG